MKLASLLLSAGVLVISTAALTATVVSQDKTLKQHEADQNQEWMKYSQPTEHHRKLDKFVGNWNQTVKWWMYPDAEPTTTTGSSTYKWILDGRYLQGECTGQMEGQPFKGMDILGYDNFAGEYTSYWVDNMSTSPMIATGSLSDKELKMTGTHDCVMTGTKDQPFKSTTKFKDANTIVYEMWAPGPDGQFFKTLEVTSTRKN